MYHVLVINNKWIFMLEHACEDSHSGHSAEREEGHIEKMMGSLGFVFVLLLLNV